MSFIKRSDKFPVCYTKPLDSLKNWNDHFFWVADFSCPARFSWHTAKNVTRDPTPVAADFNAQDYATLVAHPSPFRKCLEEFLCLVRLSRHYTLDEKTYPLFLDKDGEDMDIFAFIHTPDPTKVEVVERERKDDKPRLLKTTVGHIVPLLLVAPDRGEIELDASVDKLFDEGGSGTQTKQGDSVGGEGGQGINIQPVTETTDTVAEDNVEVRGEPISTLPFVTLFVSATPERKGEGHTDSINGLNLRTISAPQRFVISSDSSHHSGANIAEAEVDSFSMPSVPVITAATFVTSTVDPSVVVKGKIVKPYLFSADSTSTGGTDPAMGGFTDLAGSDFLIGGIHTMVDEFGPNKFFASVRRMEHDQLFTEFNVEAAHQMSLSAEVRMRAEYNIREKRRLESVVEEKNQLLKARDEEIKNLKAQMLLKEAEAAEVIRLRAEASNIRLHYVIIKNTINNILSLLSYMLRHIPITAAMINSDMPPVAPALTLVEKLYAVHNITNLVPVKLDLDELNYSSWRYFFTIHCNNFNVLKHIEPKTDDASTSTPPTEEWLTTDSIVKSWIILTLSPSLQKWFIKINPTTDRDAWERVKKLFQDNKRTRMVALKGELHDVVTYSINGLSHKYGSLAQIIAHKDPFPDIATMRSMVSTEEMRLRSKSPIQPTNMTASAPQVLLATSNIPRGDGNRNTRNHDNRKPNTSTEVCRNFGRGFCHWGDSCRFVHDSNHGTGNTRTPSNLSQNIRTNQWGQGVRFMQNGVGCGGLNVTGQQQLLQLIQAQQSLLAQYGLNSLSGQRQPLYNSVQGPRSSAPPGFTSTQHQQAQHAFSPQQQALFASTV
nr:hypothetical protein [Tanacetum cinerariifolium]